MTLIQGIRSLCTRENSYKFKFNVGNVIQNKQERHVQAVCLSQRITSTTERCQIFFFFYPFHYYRYVNLWYILYNPVMVSISNKINISIIWKKSKWLQNVVLLALLVTLQEGVPLPWENPRPSSTSTCFLMLIHFLHMISESFG